MTGPVYSVLQDRALELGPFGSSPDAQTDTDTWRHWRLARDSKDIAWLILDKADSSVNVLSAEVLEDLGKALDKLEAQPPKGLVLRSGKSNSFCVGADIKEFDKLKTQEQVEEKLTAAHAQVQRLADLSCPTLAVIHGAALGGGSVQDQHEAQDAG